MRGIATVILVAFISILVFGIVAPTVLEPVAEMVVQNQAVQNSPIDAQAFTDGLLRSILMWGPLFAIGSAVASAAVWYFRSERIGRRRV